MEIKDIVLLRDKLIRSRIIHQHISKATFLHELHKILLNLESQHFIRWDNEGKVLIVKEEEGLVSQVLAKFFKILSLENFTIKYENDVNNELKIRSASEIGFINPNYTRDRQRGERFMPPIKMKIIRFGHGDQNSQSLAPTRKIPKTESELALPYLTHFEQLLARKIEESSDILYQHVLLLESDINLAKRVRRTVSFILEEDTTLHSKLERSIEH